jgi:Zn-dependent protease with chaperone function
METRGFTPREEPMWVERWPSETPLTVLVGFLSLGVWLLLALSIFGMVYVVLIGLFFFVSHLAFIAYLRGSAVKLGLEQMPELFHRVESLARRVGLKKMPTVYVMQAGGTLNALATKFLATDFIVLFSDLLEACGDNTDARDMIIGHELGHLKEGHLRWMWFLLPGMFVPFLGTALSRAREYTCDRYGAAVCADRTGALRGLAILSAGGVHGGRVNLGALARQREDLNTAWMTIGHWLGTHPPLSHRIAALDPVLAGGRRSFARGPLGAAAILGSVLFVPLAMAVAIPVLLTLGLEEPLQADGTLEGPVAVTGDKEWIGLDEEVHEVPTMARAFGEEFAAERARRDVEAIGAVVEEYSARTGRLPGHPEEVFVVWQVLRPGDPFPTDPFDGYWYGYERVGGGYRIWSGGPDPEDPADDIVFLSAGAGENRTGAPGP